MTIICKKKTLSRIILESDSHSFQKCSWVCFDATTQGKIAAKHSKCIHRTVLDFGNAAQSNGNPTLGKTHIIYHIQTITKVDPKSHTHTWRSEETDTDNQELIGLHSKLRSFVAGI